MQRITLAVQGMTCGHCVKAVNTALAKLDGVTVEHVGIGSATVSFDSAKTSTDQIANAIDDAGYRVASTAAAPVHT